MKIKTLDKIFKILYGGFLAALVAYVIYMMMVLVISPKKDLKQRGFIACTRELVLNLGDCERGQLGCVLKAFYGDTACNSKVIYKGLTAWLKGEQSTPWANYIFEPQWQEEAENPYMGNPQKDMENMALDREFMLQKERELENIKDKALKVQESVIISDPESQIEPEIEILKEEKEAENLSQDINDEADIGEISKGDKKEEKIEKLPEPKLKSNSDKLAKKAPR